MPGCQVMLTPALLRSIHAYVHSVGASAGVPGGQATPGLPAEHAASSSASACQPQWLVPLSVARIAEDYGRS